MSYSSQSKHMWTLNQTLTDEIGMNVLLPSPFVSPTYLPYIRFNLLTRSNETKYGLKIDNTQLYTSGDTGELFDGNLTIAFWYYSPGPIGYTRHAVTRNLQTKQAPIIASMIFDYNFDPIRSAGLFSITEIADSPTTNKIRFVVTSSSEVSYTVESMAYEPGLHHILATYSIEQYTIRVDIDGKRGIPEVAGTQLVQLYPLNIKINSDVADYTAHITRQNGGFISELLVGSMAAESNEAIRMIRYGWQYLADNELSKKKFVFFGFSFPQQTAVSSNKIVARGGNIYVVRSNGEIMQGNRPIWDNEYNYPNADSLKLLNISEQDPPPENGEPPPNQRVAEWTSLGLKLKGTSVKA